MSHTHTLLLILPSLPFSTSLQASLTWTVMVIARLHSKLVSFARFPSVELNLELPGPTLRPTATLVATVPPLGPGEPPAVHGAVSGEAGDYLLVGTLAVAPVVLGDRITAVSCPRLSAVVTSGATFTELCPLSPTSMNWREKHHHTLHAHYLKNNQNLSSYTCFSARMIIIYICI